MFVGRTAIRKWITLRGGGKWMTIVETNVMTFDRNARVSRNAEYWSLRQGRRPAARLGLRLLTAPHT
ncbi:hypothetical protein [Nonomuraea indica]|uniref:Uncharacterized protein n=1 Tax=Nonomuraea indica TaxID=1581193 RepID=A0ABW7ZY07_9ACTN